MVEYLWNIFGSQDQILALPENAWINRPAERTTNELAAKTPNGPIRLDKFRDAGPTATTTISATTRRLGRTP